jgi:Aldehyde:ferredoxin oxidoreductase
MNLFPSHRTTPLPGGYMGKILRVDLTTGTLKNENLPEEPILKKFIGGQALALYILMNELPLDATPFGPENIVVIMTGPLTGNGFTPGGTKMTAVYLSPLTNTTLGRGRPAATGEPISKQPATTELFSTARHPNRFIFTSKTASPSCATPRRYGVPAPATPKTVFVRSSATAMPECCASAPRAKT